MSEVEVKSQTGTTETSPLRGLPLEIIPGKQTDQHAKPTKESSELHRMTTPVTPVDDQRPVEEKTGRWSEEEHKLFLEGLQQHGKSWKVISQMVSTRSVVQVRTHAQKFFQKLERKNNKTKPPSVPVLSNSQARPNKRKSLPTTLPSRKKASKTPPSAKETMSRTTSLSLVNTDSFSSDL